MRWLLNWSDMHAWIRDAAFALIAVGDLSVALMYAIHLEKNEKEKEKWPT
jgi:hypothetical protein